MGRYLARRLVQVVPVMFLVSVVVFALLNILPGDPAVLLAGPDATESDLQRIRERLGLDQPLHIRYVSWIKRALAGDLGQSFMSAQPVTEAIAQRFPVTFELAVVAITIASLVGVTSGVLAAVRRNTWIDQFLMSFALVGISIPNFWAGMLLILAFSLKLGWFPSVGFVYFHEDPWRNLWYLVLPGLAMGLTLGGEIARMTRSSILEILPSDFVRTARAKGLPEWGVIWRHVLRPGLIPVITVIGLNFGAVLGGAIVTESVFSLPGVGRLLITSISSRDYPVVQGVILAVTGLYVFINLFVDLLYALIDPRIQYD